MRKKITFILTLLLCVIHSFATNRYISASGDNTTGLSPSTAWNTIAKLNLSMSSIAAGDSILFHCGETFYGGIILTKSGSSGNPIVIASYGTGAKPIISGLETLTGLTNAGNGIWTKTLPAATPNFTILTFNGKLQQIGRFPNTDQTNGGYLTYTDHNVTIPNITGSALSATTNWTNSVVVIRKEHWVLDRCRVTSHVGGTVTFVNPPAGTNSPYPGKKGYGYFFQNDLRTLDKLGEWHFDSTTKLLSIYFGAVNPNTITIKASTVDIVVSLAANNYIVVHNLHVEGANVTGINGLFNPNVLVKNCTVNNCYNGINLKSITASGTTQYCKVTNCLNNGMEQSGTGAGLTFVQYDTVKNCGEFAGMGGSRDGTYNGLIQPAGTAGATINGCVFDSIGYIPITFGGNNCNVYNNVVSNFCYVKDDGSAIYTGNGFTNNVQSNRKVYNNIMFNGIGAIEGTTNFVSHTTADAHGLYIDAQSNNVYAYDNTIFNMPDGVGIFNNVSKDLQITRNTMYNVTKGYRTDRMPDWQQIRNITYTSNIVYPITSNFVYWNGNLNTPTPVTIKQDMRNMFTRLDSNYYRDNIPASFDWFYHLTKNGKYVDPPPSKLAQWKDTIGTETNSVAISTATPYFIYNATPTATITSLGMYQYKDVYGTTYSGFYTLQPFTSALLFQSGITPVANASGDTTIILPQSSLTINGQGSDADGVIVSFNWSQMTGPNTAVITPNNTSSTVVSGLVQGIYKFILTVTDNSGLTDKDTIQVTVIPAATTPPTANAGADKVITLPTTTTSVTGSGTNGSGSSRTYLWSQVSGPATVTIVSPTSASTTINGLTVNGTYALRLDVTNNLGATASDFMQITVNAAPIVQPTANAGADKAITLPTTSTSATASVTLGSGTSATYSWVQTAGPSTISFGSSTALTTTINNLTVAGNYSVQFTILNNQGNSASDNMDIVVSPSIPPVNQPPVSVAGANQTITLPANTASVNGNGSSDPDGSIVAYQWTIIGPNVPTNSTQNSVTTTFGNLIQGAYQARLKVTDNNGDTASSTLTITVNAAPNQLPTANAGNDTTIVLPDNEGVLNGSLSSDPDGTITVFKWVQISGPNTASIANSNISTTAIGSMIEGAYLFRLTVTGSGGSNDTASDVKQVTIERSPNQIPTAYAGPTQTIQLPKDSTTLVGSGNDEDGTIVSYTWQQVSGPSINTLQGNNTSTVEIKQLKAGKYVYRLIVTDDIGATGTSLVEINVLAEPIISVPVLLRVQSF